MLRRDELSSRQPAAGKIMQERDIITYEDSSFSTKRDQVAIESPVTISVNGGEFATMLCTPSYVEDLALGFLASEGAIRQADDVESISVADEKGLVYVKLADAKPLKDLDVSKRYIGSCCGKSRQFYFQNDVRTAKTVMTNTCLTADQCFRLMSKLEETSGDFKQTGGLHNVALCSSDELLLNRSDIGRHNALDKVYGYCLNHRISLKDKVIVFSGRLSSEVLLKVSKIGAGIVLSKSAPSSLALDLAEDLGITTVGFIRHGRFNVYTHKQRITS